MNRHVEQVTRPGQVFVLPPAPARLRPVEEPLAAEVPDLAKGSGLHEVPQVPHRRGKPVGERRHMLQVVIRAARYISADSAKFSPSGFSHIMCLPPLAQASTIS